MCRSEDKLAASKVHARVLLTVCISLPHGTQTKPSLRRPCEMSGPQSRICKAECALQSPVLEQGHARARHSDHRRRKTCQKLSKRCTCVTALSRGPSPTEMHQGCTPHAKEFASLKPTCASSDKVNPGRRPVMHIIICKYIYIYTYVSVCVLAGYSLSSPSLWHVDLLHGSLQEHSQRSSALALVLCARSYLQKNIWCRWQMVSNSNISRLQRRFSVIALTRR